MAGAFSFTTRTVVNDKALYSWSKSQQGPLARHIRAKGAQVAMEAKLLVGVRTGRLGRSIKVKRDRSPTGEYGVIVGSDLRYAMVHHEGSRPHTISAREPGKHLRFVGRNGMVYRRTVRHPGTKPRPYLTFALRSVFSR